MAYLAQRFVDNNVQANAPALSLQLVPQPPHAVPRLSGEALGSGIARAGSFDYSNEITWLAGPPLWAASLGVARVGNLKRLWVDFGTGDGYVEKRKYRSANDLNNSGESGGWAVDTSIGLLYVFAPVSNPATLGWDIRDDEGVIFTTNHESKRNLKRLRYIHHPELGGFEYPHPPNRTLNYFRGPVRGADVNAAKTLRSSVTIKDQHEWEDVVITEIWQGGGSRLSMATEFFDALHMIRATEPAIGRRIQWFPKDQGYMSHSIIPVSLSVGSSEADLNEIRVRPSTALEGFIDRTVAWSFRLTRPPRVVHSLLTAEGY